MTWPLIDSDRPLTDNEVVRLEGADQNFRYWKIGERVQAADFAIRVRRWDFTFGDFNAAALNITKAFGTPGPVNPIIFKDALFKLTEEFAGGAVSAATLELGETDVPDTDSLVLPQNVFVGAGLGYKGAAIGAKGTIITSAAGGTTQVRSVATEITATLKLTGANGDQLTAGAGSLWFMYQLLP